MLYLNNESAFRFTCASCPSVVLIPEMALFSFTKKFLAAAARQRPDPYADVDALIEDVGYKPATTMEEGVANFVDWYRGFYKV